MRRVAALLLLASLPALAGTKASLNVSATVVSSSRVGTRPLPAPGGPHVELDVSTYGARAPVVVRSETAGGTLLTLVY